MINVNNDTTQIVTDLKNKFVEDIKNFPNYDIDYKRYFREKEDVELLLFGIAQSSDIAARRLAERFLIDIVSELRGKKFDIQQQRKPRIYNGEIINAARVPGASNSKSYRFKLDDDNEIKTISAGEFIDAIVNNEAPRSYSKFEVIEN